MKQQQRMMANTFHIKIELNDQILTAAQARATILGTGRRPDNLDKVLGKSKNWARIDMAASALHPDVQCSTAAVFHARAVADAWNALHGAWDDPAVLAKNPVTKAFGGALFDDGLIFNEWMDRKEGNRHPCPVFILSMDYDPDVMTSSYNGWWGTACWLFPSN